MTNHTNPLADLHTTLTGIAARYNAGAAKVTVYFGRNAFLLITARKAVDVRETLNQIIADADALGAELPGRTLGISVRRSFRIWNTHDDSGYCTGKRAQVTITMTEDEHNGVLRGSAACLPRS